MTTPENYLAVKDALIAAGFEPDNAEVSLQAVTLAEPDADDAEKVMRLIDPGRCSGCLFQCGYQ